MTSPIPASRLYSAMNPGEPVVIRYRTQNFKMSCCDCGLVHDFKFSVRGGKLFIRGRRDNRATAQRRRKSK